MDNINFYQLITAISLSVDLSECSTMPNSNFTENITNINYSAHKFTNHTKRTCYVAVKIAELISSNEDFLLDTYISSALHDIGSSQDIESTHLNPDFITDHCIHGEALTNRLNIGGNIPKYIKYHHENYDGTGSFNFKGDEIPLVCRVIRLADLFELLFEEGISNYLQREKINKWIKSNSGSVFDPYVVDAYMKIQSKEKFWWDVENLGFIGSIMNEVRPSCSKVISFNDLKTIAQVFADIIDSKSSFTYRHSSNLANIISHISDYMGFDKEKKDRFVVSALMHDIGKIGIPNSILNKNGKLNSIEFTIMKCHTYYTRIILSQIDGIEDITNWGANHHEKLDGTGYPIGLTGDKLSFEERIMAVCDIYEALSSKRPYKQSLSNDEVFEIINPMAESGKICPKALNILKEIV